MSVPRRYALPPVAQPYFLFFVNVTPAVRRAQAEHPGAKFSPAWTRCANGAALDACVERIVRIGLVAPPSVRTFGVNMAFTYRCTRV